MPDEILSVADTELVDKLVDLNVDQVDIKYPWDEDFQRIVVGMLLSDRFFITQSIGLIKPTYFQNEIHQTIYRILIVYFETHKQLPSKIFVKQSIIDKLRNKYQHQEDKETFQTIKLVYLGELNTIYEYYSKGGVGEMMPALDSPEALLTKIESFAKTQAIRQGFFRSLELLRKSPDSDETWTKIDEIYKEARLVERQTDMGLDYFETMEERYERMKQEEESAEVFSVGFETIDRGLHGGGLKRGEIGAVMSLAGRGKSLSLVVASIKNISKAKKVLFISTEMDSDRIATRFDSQISLVKQDDLMLRKEDVWRALKDEVRDYEDKRRLIIKQFPSGTADVNTIRAYHSQCVMHGFRPDLVIVDYLGDMKDLPGIPTWESKFRMIRDLRGFGKVENHCTLTAIQPNRTASVLSLEEVMGEGEQGASFMQNQVLDAFWSINQTDDEKKACMARVWVIKARNGKSRYRFKVKFDYNVLSIKECSDDTYRFAMNRIKDLKAESTDDYIDRVVTGGQTFQPTEGERVQ